MISSCENCSCSSPLLLRIGFDEQETERSISRANWTIIYIPTSTCVVFEDEVRPSIRTRFRSCSPFNLPSSSYRDSWQIDRGLLMATISRNSIIKRISLYPSSFRTRLSRRTEKVIRLFRIAAYHGIKIQLPILIIENFCGLDARRKTCNNDNREDLGQSML